MITQLITNLATSLLVAVVTAVVTVRLSLKQFRTERWWQLKAEAYSRIIEALHHVVVYCNLNLNEVQGAKYTTEYMEEIQRSYNKAVRDAEMAAGIGAYVISDEVAKILAELESRPRTLDWVDHLQTDRTDYSKAIAKIRQLAKKDLQVGWRFRE